MRTREELEKRVAELEGVFARGFAMRGYRRHSAATFAGVPVVDIAMGPDFAHGEMRGHAKGIVAIGDIATGVIAIGGVARGAVALGGIAIGLVSFGGLSLAALAAVGGIAVGGIALGGGALGGVALGGAAGGYYACGGAAVGDHVVTATSNRSDVEAERFFREHGLASYCGAGHVYRQQSR
jgi:hypothetical protein